MVQTCNRGVRWGSNQNPPKNSFTRASTNDPAYQIHTHTKHTNTPQHTHTQYKQSPPHAHKPVPSHCHHGRANLVIWTSHSMPCKTPKQHRISVHTHRGTHTHTHTHIIASVHGADAPHRCNLTSRTTGDKSNVVNTSLLKVLLIQK